MSGYGTSDAVDREAAYLLAVVPVKSNPNDQTAYWDAIQAHKPTIPGDRRLVYVLEPTIQVLRVTARRSRARYTFRTIARWPMKNQAGTVADQRNFKIAVDQLLAAIVGPDTDKSHGNQFWSVAGENVGNAPAVKVEFNDPEKAIETGQPLTATLTYVADDPEQTL